MKKTADKKLNAEQVAAMVKEYLESDLSAREVGAKYGVSGPNVMYHTRKVRKALEESKSEK